MSFKFYNKFWIVTSENLKNVLIQEKLIEKLKYTDDRNVAHGILSNLYPKYVVLCNNLSEIYDQTLQVQKRGVVKELLEAASARLQELRQKLCEIELSEIVYVDQTLIENKWTPQDITLLKPFYFPFERKKEIQDLIDEVPEELEQDEEVGVNPIKGKKKLTQEEIEQQRIHENLMRIAKLIKLHEKGRTARIWWNNIKRDPEGFRPRLKEDFESVPYTFYHKHDTVQLVQVKRTYFESNFYQEPVSFDNHNFYEKPEVKVEEEQPQFGRRQKKKSATKIVEVILEEIPKEESIQEVVEINEEERKELERRDHAALAIQCAWKYLKFKRMLKAKRLKKLILLGMANEMKWDFSSEAKIEETRLKRRQKKKYFDEAFINAIQDEKARILKVRKPWLMEDISDHIREWFREFYYTVGDFDRYPEEFEGGTILVVKGETMTTEEFKANLEEKEANKAKTPEQRAKEKEAKLAEKEKQKEKERREKEKRKQELERRKEREKEGKFRMEFEVKYPEDRSKALNALEKVYENYVKDWYFIDESKNPKEDPIKEWISIDKYAEVHQELRIIVDELMRIEYELLRVALAKDQKKKYKPQKKKKEKKKKEKKGKKKKVQKNILEEKSVKELYDEMKELGIIRKYEKCSLDDFCGDMNYRAYEDRQAIFDPIHGNDELKTTLRTCILGMGPLNLAKPKSILLVGPPLSGKKYLAYAICSETNSVLFDLSPEKITGIPDMKYFVSALTALAQTLQPSIFLINGGHKPFYKKIPKTEVNLNPRKIGSYLVKLMKNFKKDDKIMLIGTSNEPWNSKLGKMKKCYEKILLVPRSNYGTTFITWREEMLKVLGVPRDIDVSPLTMVTQGFSTGEIMDCIKNCLNIERRMKFSVNPLNMSEFLEYFLQIPKYPPTIEDFQKYLKWYRKANKLAAAREKIVTEAHPAPEEPKKK